MSVRPEILVVGSVALDSVRTPYGEAVEALGGSASYFSLSASQFAPAAHYRQNCNVSASDDRICF